MKKIFLPNINNKFYNNIRHLSNNILRIFSAIPIDIYKIHEKISADIYLFDSSYISSELVQFISEYSDLTIKVFVYHSPENLEQDAIRYMKKCRHIVPYKKFDKFSMYKNVVQLPKYIINENIFYDQNIHPKIDKAIYFLDNDNSIPKAIEANLYPNKKDSNILLFNNSNISHHQNLGMLTEPDKANLLNKHKYYICNENRDYAAEAYRCGCTILDNDLSDITVDDCDIQTFGEFIKKIT
jgi:hypothetical protein